MFRSVHSYGYHCLKFLGERTKTEEDILSRMQEAPFLQGHPVQGWKGLSCCSGYVSDALVTKYCMKLVGVWSDCVLSC